MAEIRVYPEGFRELARRVGGIRVARVLTPPLIRGLEHFRSSLAHYPAKPPGSTYTRQGRLGSSWAIRHNVNARGVTGEAGTNVVYAPYVQDAERQAWMHRARWHNTDQRVAAMHRGTILDDFTDVLQGELRRSR